MRHLWSRLLVSSQLRSVAVKGINVCLNRSKTVAVSDFRRDRLAALEFLLGFLKPQDWVELLSLEKERRGVAENALVFIGAANLARIAWCPMQAVRRSRAGESNFFGSYLEDRLEFAIETGRISELPRDRAEWLDVAALDVPFAEVERVWWPDLPTRLTAFTEGLYIQEGERGWFEPSAPRVRWHFPVENYVVIAAPDGLSLNEVLETKSSGSTYLAQVQRPLAELQGDIYGYLFGRRVKLLGQTIGDGPITVDHRPVVAARAREAVRTFGRIDSGEVPRPPSESWKCRRCEVEVGCPISRAVQR